MREKLRIDRALPSATKENMEHELPVRMQDLKLIEEPKLQKLSTLVCMPVWHLVRTDRVEPKLVQLSTDNAEPKRDVDRMLILEPTSTMPSMDAAPCRIVFTLTLIEDPKREQALNDKPLPSEAKFNTLRPEPKRAKLRRLKVLPIST
jgi:hypothetical protein